MPAVFQFSFFLHSRGLLFHEAAFLVLFVAVARGWRFLCAWLPLAAVGFSVLDAFLFPAVAQLLNAVFLLPAAGVQLSAVP